MTIGMKNISSEETLLRSNLFGQTQYMVSNPQQNSGPSWINNAAGCARHKAPRSTDWFRAPRGNLLEGYNGRESGQNRCRTIWRQNMYKSKGGAHRLSKACRSVAFTRPLSSAIASFTSSVAPRSSAPVNGSFRPTGRDVSVYGVERGASAG